MSTVQGDISLNSKSENIGAGSLDWQFSGGNPTILTDPGDFMMQALLKSTISPVNSIGYGVAIHEFIGTKHIVPARAGVAMRLLRTARLISIWYQRNLELVNIDTSFDVATQTYRLYLDIELRTGEIYYS